MGTSVSPTPSVDIMSISMLLASSISPYLCLPQPICSVHCGLEVFRWCIAVNATLRGENEMIGVGRMPHQLSLAVDDISTSVFDWVLVIVIPFHILQSVWFPLPERLPILHARHEPLDVIPIFEDSEMQPGLFILEQVVIVRLHALLLHPTLGIFVMFTCH